jgi:3-dehydro-L-gulonate 2-dehydrogenase
MLRVPYLDLEAALESALRQLGLIPDRAHACARLFAETTRDGVYTHGLARFPRFSAMVKNATVDVAAVPTCTAGFGAIERWDGHRGVGNLNAQACMDRAVALAREHGVGAVAQTNHWMRGGSYGWQAAEAGLFALCFTNTLPNLPAWGTGVPVMGNNPLVLAVPRPGGAHLVLDMAMSQYSYGTISAYIKRGAQLPFPGGFDASGTLTTDPAAIEQTNRALPIGLWKGSGLALTLDLIAAMLSGGLATHQIPHDPTHETGLSQVFLAIDPSHICDPEALAAVADSAIQNLHAATPLEPGKPSRYPGEQTLLLRAENLRLGIPVDEDIWRGLLAGDYS